MGRYRNVAVIIPAHNEEKTIGSIIENIRSKVATIVIDDKSTDSTCIVAKNCGAKVFSNKKKIGYGRSLNLGLQKAKKLGYKIVISMDADGEHSSESLNNFLKFSKNIPLILGVRKKKKRFAEIIFCKYFEILFGVSDIMCGMRSINFKLVDKIKINSLEDELGISWLVKLLKQNIKFYEIPVDGIERKDSSRFGEGIKPNIKIIKILIKYFFKKL